MGLNREELLYLRQLIIEDNRKLRKNTKDEHPEVKILVQDVIDSRLNLANKLSKLMEECDE